MPIIEFSCLSFCCSLYIFWILNIYQLYDLQIFSSHSLGFLLIFLTIPIDAQKFLVLMKSNLCIFSLLSCAFDVVSKNPLQIQGHEDLQHFPVRILWFQPLTFRSLIHFELIFVHGVMYGSKFILLHGKIQWSQHHLLKRKFFPK